MEPAAISEHRLETLRWIFVKGTSPSVFSALGEHLRPLVQETVANLTATTDLARRLERPAANARFRSISHLLPTWHPGEWAEFRALAAGAEIAIDDLLLLNLRGDLGRDDLGCSGLAQTSDTGLLWGHNEDGNATLLDGCVLLTLEIQNAPTVTTWWYPGFLPGNTFTFSDAGLMWGGFNVNIVSPPTLSARSFVARGLQRWRSLDEATAHLANHPSAGGFGYMLCSSELPRARLVETGGGAMSVVHAYPGVQPVLWHTNHLRYLTPGADKCTHNSLQRGEVFERLTQQRPVSAEALRNVLAEKPLPDGVRATSRTGSATLASVVVDQSSGSGIAELLTPRERVLIPVADLATGQALSAKTSRRATSPWD